MAKVVAKDGKGLDKSPIVGMQLGRGHDNLRGFSEKAIRRSTIKRLIVDGGRWV